MRSIIGCRTLPTMSCAVPGQPLGLTKGAGPDPPPTLSRLIDPEPPIPRSRTLKVAGALQQRLILFGAAKIDGMELAAVAY